MTSKGGGLLRSNLPLGDTILRGASYFVTVHSRLNDKVIEILAVSLLGTKLMQIFKETTTGDES